MISRVALHKSNRAIQWGALLVLSIVFVLILEAVHLPAALLLGAMSAAILIAVAGGSVQVPQKAFFAAQGVIGCMIARSIAPATLGTALQNWPLFLGTSLGVVFIASALGWLIARWRILPGTTAIWGSSPGAATAMVLMAGANGADARIVAFMQYLRVVIVSAVAAMIAGLWAPSQGPAHGPAHGATPGIQWFAPIDWPHFGETLLIIAAGIGLGLRLRIPAGPFLVPMAIGAVVSGLGFLKIELPAVILAVSYAMVGWSIGLRFTPAILSHAARALPSVVASILALIGICGLLAFLLVHFAGIDPLTAYLATSPGGADSVAIIAASTKVDVAFVMAQQLARFLVVLFVGPAIANIVARWTTGSEKSK